MIAHLRGRILQRSQGAICLDVNGVGYEVQVDRQTLVLIGAEGSDAALFIRTVVREDSITLFGFGDPVARDVFDLLTQVSGVGPRLASTILGGLVLGDFVQAVRERDLRLLTAIPGVGRKIAERLVLELREKFMALPVEVAPGGVPAELVADVRSALANLGFSAREIDAAIRGLKPTAARMNLEDVLREALAARGR